MEEKVNPYGFMKEADEIYNEMLKAIAADKELYYRYIYNDVEGDGLELIKRHAKACYAALACVLNYKEMSVYASGNVESVSFDLSELMEQLVLRAKYTMRASGITLTSDVDEGLVGFCDPKRLCVCVANLIVNAFQWVEQDEGRINVRVKRYSDHAAITVSDDGYGMTDEELADAMSKNGGRIGGLDILKRFCNSVGTVPVINTSENGGFLVSFKVPLDSDSDELRAHEEYADLSLLDYADVLYHKLEAASVRL